MFTQYRRIVTKYGLNGQADIYFPEDQGVVQIENFGIHLNADGACCRASPGGRDCFAAGVNPALAFDLWGL